MTAMPPHPLVPAISSDTSRNEALAILRQNLEIALLQADEIDLPFVGIGICQALEALDDQETAMTWMHHLSAPRKERDESGERELVWQYRPTMEGLGLYAWAVDARDILVSQAATITRLKAELAQALDLPEA